MLVPVEICNDLKSCDFDGVVVVADKVADLPFDDIKKPLQVTEGTCWLQQKGKKITLGNRPFLQPVVDVDKEAEKGVFVAPAPGLPSKRVIFSGTGPMDKDYEDVRGYERLRGDDQFRQLTSYTCTVCYREIASSIVN